MEAKEKKLAEMGFAGGTKLSINYVNAFRGLYSLFRRRGKTMQFEEMQPVKTYEEYFSQAYPDLCDYIMQLSDFEAVMALNCRAHVFNVDLERIKREKDEETVFVFLGELITFMRLKKID